MALKLRPNRIIVEHEIEEDGKGINITKVYKFDTYTFYIENNGKPESEIRQLVRKLILSTPGYGEQKLNATDNELFFLVYANKPERESVGQTKEEKKIIPALDRTTIRLADEEPFYYIFGLTQEGREPDHKKKEGLTTEQYNNYIQEKKKAESSSSFKSTGLWADDVTDFHDSIIDIEKKYSRLTTRAKIPGLTIVRMANRKEWERYIDESSDAAVIRGFVSEVHSKFVPNKLSLQDFPPGWTNDNIEGYFRPLAISDNPKYPQFEFIGTPKGVRVVITFDPRFQRAAFIFRLIEHLSLPSKVPGSNIRKDISVRYVSKGGQSGSRSGDRGGSQTRERGTRGRGTRGRGRGRY